MKCEDPILCYDDGVNKQFRHFSLANPIFKNKSNKLFNCGTCTSCRKKRATELAMRCVLEASLYKQNSFLTLTYDEKQKDYHNDFQYSDIQDFKKRLRRYCDYHYHKKIKIFNVHEYGKNQKKHWHLVVFNHDFQDKQLHTIKNSNSLYTSEILNNLWPHGHHTIGQITEASAMYTAQYTQKDVQYGNNDTNGRHSHSKHSGIGRDYFLIHYSQILRLGYVPFKGRKFPIPRYFQKIAHKHFSHFYQTQNFIDLPERKKLYTPFKPGQANKHMADLYLKFASDKEKYIQELTEDWDALMQEIAYTKEKPEFVKSAENHLYDLKNRQPNKNF